MLQPLPAAADEDSARRRVGASLRRPDYPASVPQRDASDLLPMTLGGEPSFCPACGRPLTSRILEADHRPRLVCPEGHVTWRNPRLVVGTLPIGRGRVYLARRAIEPASGRWTYPGGFLEVGESAQEGARRETEEETKLLVEVGGLIGAYSRPHVGIVTLIFEATVIGGQALPGAETAEVRGFDPDEIPWDELAFTTVESALRDWIARQPGRRPVPEPELYVTGDSA
jgi:ADP-ribose pyrophosphatase YjhB (NUDIX family)